MHTPISTLDEFIENDVPGIVARRSRLHVLLLSYNTVEGVEDGKVPHDKDGLVISVKTGGLVRHSKRSLRRFMDEVADVNRNKPILSKLDGEEAQRRVDEAVLRMEVPEDALAFVYAGLTGFESAMVSALHLAERLSKGAVYVVTCGCHTDGKREYVGRVGCDVPPAGMLFTDECGGRFSMKKIADELIAAWPY